jgi:hypothetical protein
VALAIDGSTPAVATQTSSTIATVTTASFTPPAGSTLLVLYSGNTVDPTSPATPTITDSLGVHLTYTLSDFSARADGPAADGQAAIWTAPVASSAAMTVTVTNQAPSGSRHAALAVIVLTGAHATPVGAHGKSGSTLATSIAQSYTAQATSGWGFIAVCDWWAQGPETAGTGCTLIGSGDLGTPDISWAFARRTIADDSNGVSNTLNVNVGPSGPSTNLRWAYVEIVPAAVADGSTGKVLVPPASRPARPAGTAITLDHSTVIQSSGVDLPLVQVQPSAGTLPPRLGRAVVLGSRADPPASTPPAPAPFTSAGRPPPAVGSSWLTTSRAEPDFPPAPQPFVTAARPTPQPGTTWIAGLRTPTDTPTEQPAITSAGRPPLPAGSTWLALTRADPPPDTATPQPSVVVARSIPPSGSAWLTASRADVVAAVDAPVPAPIQAGRAPTPQVGAAQILTPRADPSPNTPPAPQPFTTTARPPAFPGTAWIVAPRADPAVAPDPMPSVLVTAPGRPRALPGAALVLRQALDAPGGYPALTVAAGARQALSGAALLLRSTFTTPPPVAFIHPLLGGTGIQLAVSGSSWLQRPTEFTGHFCPPPTPRPDLGTTARPPAGVTSRPDTGVTTEC